MGVFQEQNKETLQVSIVLCPSFARESRVYTNEAKLTDLNLQLKR